MGYGTQGEPVQESRKGNPLDGDEGVEDLRMPAVHARQTSPDLSRSEGSRETSLCSLK